MKLGTGTLLIGFGLLALFLWAWNKSKQPGSSGGIFSQIGSGVAGAMGLTQNVTENSVKTGETLGGGVKDAAGGVISIADKVAHTGGWLNPVNWG